MEQSARFPRPRGPSKNGAFQVSINVIYLFIKTFLYRVNQSTKNAALRLGPVRIAKTYIKSLK